VLNKKFLDTEVTRDMFEELHYGPIEYDNEEVEIQNREVEMMSKDDESQHMKQPQNYRIAPDKVKKEYRTRSLKKILKNEGDEIRQHLIEQLEGTPKKED
jgi:hypothetical protein